MSSDPAPTFTHGSNRGVPARHFHSQALSLSDPEITGSGADLGVSAAASIVAGKGDGGRRGVGNALLFGIGGVILVVIFLALAVRVASRGDTVSALSGLLEDLFDPHRRRGAPVLDPEVPERPARRRFSAAYKATCVSGIYRDVTLR